MASKDWIWPGSTILQERIASLLFTQLTSEATCFRLTVPDAAVPVNCTSMRRELVGTVTSERTTVDVESTTGINQRRCVWQ